MPPDYSLAAMAAKLDVSIATLNRWIAAGTAPPSYLRGRRRYFPPDRFEKWLAATRAGAR